MTEELHKLVELNETGRCIRCKRSAEDMITCERCFEFRYCSIHCLEDDHDNHQEICIIIGLKKGLCIFLPKEEAERWRKIKEKARLLNNDGSIRENEKLVNTVEVEEFGTNINDLIYHKKQYSNRKPRLKKNKRKKNKGSIEVRGKNSKILEQRGNDKKGKDKKSVESLLAGGRFGGAVKVAKNVESGDSFGKDWWKRKQKVKTEIGAGLVSGAYCEKANMMAGKKYKDFYSDSEDEDKGKNEELKETAETKNTSESLSDSASVSSGKMSGSEVMLSGSDVTKCDQKKAEEEVGGNHNERGSGCGDCSHCKKTGPLLKCSICGEAKYCDKVCQKGHYNKHKEYCRLKERFDIALSKVPAILTFAIRFMFGAFLPSPYLSSITNPLTHAVLSCRYQVMLEIISQHPLPQGYGAFVRDLSGKITKVIFEPETNYYNHLSLPLAFKTPVHLSHCLEPGNFVLLLEAQWSYLWDGTPFIQIKNLENSCFIFMNDQ